MVKRKYHTKREKNEQQIKKELKIEKKLERKLKKKFMPQKPLSAYLLYCNQRRPKLKEEHTGIVPREMISIMSKEWNSMTDEQKKPFYKLQDEDKLRYIKETTEYNNKLKGLKLKKKKIEYANKYTQIEPGDFEEIQVNNDNTKEEDIEMKNETKEEIKINSAGIAFDENVKEEVKSIKQEEAPINNEDINKEEPKTEEIKEEKKDEPKPEEAKMDVEIKEEKTIQENEKKDEPKPEVAKPVEVESSKEDVYNNTIQKQEIKVTKLEEIPNEKEVKVCETKENIENISVPTSVETNI